MTAVTVRGVRIGEGPPAIIVPLTAATPDALVAQAADAVAAAPDVVEWRVDLLDGMADTDAVVAAGRRLVAALGGIPLLVTVRTTDEGGRAAVTPDAYVALYRAVLAAGVADLVDVEVLRDAVAVRTLVDLAHDAGVVVVGSNHDFTGTPPQPELESRLLLMAELGADVLKLAVMPHDPGDVLALLGATWAVSRRVGQPVITMAMGTTGVVSRLAGGVFGSAATFGTVGGSGAASAPGQVDVTTLRAVLAVVHAD
ncbi:3-dehydroquinate dehydratase [Actinomycetota bacterium]|nr:3-dehydroquinate dehydratase [Actinomycetota bacterium]